MDILAEAAQAYLHRSKGGTQQVRALGSSAECVSSSQQSGHRNWPLRGLLDPQEEPPDLEELLVRMAALLKSYPGGLTETCIVSELSRAVRLHQSLT